MSDARSRWVQGARIRPVPRARLRVQASPMLLAMHLTPASRYCSVWTSAGWNSSSSLVGLMDAAASAALLSVAASVLKCCFTTLSFVPDLRLSVLWKSADAALDGVRTLFLTSLK